ncbi:hypothetical protein BFF98_06850 [Corynebacterium pseudotuberculosis]|nr:hypothetical protein BFF98_06850 [Corynebacterium pseudotuberculosis]
MTSGGNGSMLKNIGFYGKLELKLPTLVNTPIQKLRACIPAEHVGLSCSDPRRNSIPIVAGLIFLPISRR